MYRLNMKDYKLSNQYNAEKCPVANFGSSVLSILFYICFHICNKNSENKYKINKIFKEGGLLLV